MADEAVRPHQVAADRQRRQDDPSLVKTQTATARQRRQANPQVKTGKQRPRASAGKIYDVTKSTTWDRATIYDVEAQEPHQDQEHEEENERKNSLGI
ncbi:hypothetical protein MTO96_036754 [Rhipicephalus appendiculatus]